jgi:hypothetical protein
MFSENRQYFLQKLVKFAEINVHDIDPKPRFVEQFVLKLLLGDSFHGRSVTLAIYWFNGENDVPSSTYLRR